MIGIRKLKFNTKYLEICFYVLLVVMSAIILEKLLSNLGSITLNLNSTFKMMRSILAPVIYGIFIAFFVNIMMSWIEKNLFGRIKVFNERNSIKRVLSIFVTYIFFIGCMIWIIAYLLPEVTQSIQTLVRSLPSNIYYLERQYYNAFGDDNMFEVLLDSVNKTLNTSYHFKDIFDLIFQPVMNAVVSLPNVINRLLVSTFNAAYAILNFVLGMFVAFYLLCDKENLGEVSKKIIYTIFKRSRADSIINVSKSSTTIFKSFVAGKTLDSLIIGLIFFVVALLVKAPYPLLLSLIIGITNMIPVFGPFIGAVPVVIIVLLNNITNPLAALWMALIIFALQQFDGIVLGPKILGESTGLRPVWVIIAIIVGGAIANIPGMFFGTPVFAVLRNLLMGIINREYDKKYLKDESPNENTETDDEKSEGELT